MQDFFHQEYEWWNKMDLNSGMICQVALISSVHLTFGFHVISKIANKNQHILVFTRNTSDIGLRCSCNYHISTWYFFLIKPLHSYSILQHFFVATNLRFPRSGWSPLWHRWLEFAWRVSEAIAMSSTEGEQHDHEKNIVYIRYASPISSLQQKCTYIDRFEGCLLLPDSSKSSCLFLQRLSRKGFLLSPPNCLTNPRFFRR